MSGNNGWKEVVSEKQILTEFLKLYKTFPCLWDQKHILYSNREARDRAYEVLLEKYKLCHENATLTVVKKKIENMRCAYRRDHKKVLMSKFRGSNYKPHLWYYDLLTFLNENHSNDNDNDNDQQDESMIDESMVTQYNNHSYQDFEELEDSEEEVTKPKRTKTNNSSNTIYVAEDNFRNEDNVVQDVYEVEQPQSYIVSNEAEAFGTTIGFQLKELKHMQRIFAEKLISDVIFQARLGQLTTETALSSNDD